MFVQRKTVYDLPPCSPIARSVSCGCDKFLPFYATRTKGTGEVGKKLKPIFFKGFFF